MADRKAALETVSPAAKQHRRECQVQARWLAGIDASEYVVACYEAGLSSAAFREGHRPRGLDRVLNAFVRSGLPGAALADAYARVFAPAGELRRKQVLLVSILESTHPADSTFEARASSAALAAGGLLLIVFGFALRLMLALPVIGGAHLLSFALRPAPR